MDVGDARRGSWGHPRGLEGCSGFGGEWCLEGIIWGVGECVALWVV